ncbi:MAG: hypothetical protein V9F00_18910 [Nocardioides sp.]
MSSRSTLVVLADRGEDLGLLDGVDAEVGLEVEVGVEQVGRVTGELRDDVDDLLGHLVDRRARRDRCDRLRPVRTQPAPELPRRRPGRMPRARLRGPVQRRRRWARGCRPCRGSTRRRA